MLHYHNSGIRLSKPWDRILDNRIAHRALATRTCSTPGPLQLLHQSTQRVEGGLDRIVINHWGWAKPVKERVRLLLRCRLPCPWCRRSHVATPAHCRHLDHDVLDLALQGEDHLARTRERHAQARGSREGLGRACGHAGLWPAKGGFKPSLRRHGKAQAAQTSPWPQPGHADPGSQAERGHRDESRADRGMERRRTERDRWAWAGAGGPEACTWRRRPGGRDQPTEPSSFRANSLSASAANSIGSWLNTSRQKPLTIIDTASSKPMPRLCR